MKAALNDFGAFEEPQIASYSHQILSGLEYLHKRSVSRIPSPLIVHHVYVGISP